MLAIPSTIGRARLRQTAAGLRISIPVQRSAYRFFLSLGTCAFIAWALQARAEDSKVVLLITAALILVNVARNGFWNLLGEEIVTVNKVALSLRYDVCGIGWTRNYFVNRISGMRFLRTPNPRQIQDDSNEPRGFLGFDYDSGNPRFGRGLSESEVRELVTLLESYSGAALSSTHTLPPRPLPGGVLAQEVNRNLGVTYIMGMGTGTFYFLGTLLDVTALRVGADVIALLFAGAGIVAAAGYRYRFTARGIEISTLGIPLRFVDVDRITHYEETRLTFGDSFSLGMAERKSYLWVGIPVRIQTLDGEVLLGHMKPAILIRDLDMMKQAAATQPSQAQVASAGAS